MPIVYYALFDFQHPKSTFLAQPHLYRIGLFSRSFGTRVFWYWFSYAFLQALLIYYICFYAIETTLMPSGTSGGGLWLSGSVVYAGVVIIANVKILDHSHTYNVQGVSIVIASILAYFLVFWVENLKLEVLKGVAGWTLGRQPVTYFALGFCLMQTYTVDKIVGLVRREIDRRIDAREDKEEEKERMERVKWSLDSITGFIVVSKHSGFAFAEENNPNP